VGKSLSAFGYYSLHSCSPTLNNKGELCVARFRSSLELERIDTSVYRTGPVNTWLAANQICKEGGALLLKNANQKQNRNRNQNQNPEHQITPDFPIFLRKLDGSTAVLSVRADDYEEDLCREAVTRAGVPGDQLFLTFVNTVLRPRQNNGISIGVKKSSRRLRDLGISRNSTVTMCIFGRGGSNASKALAELNKVFHKDKDELDRMEKVWNRRLKEETDRIEETRGQNIAFANAQRKCSTQAEVDFLEATLQMQFGDRFGFLTDRKIRGMDIKHLHAALRWRRVPFAETESRSELERTLLRNNTWCPFNDCLPEEPSGTTGSSYDPNLRNGPGAKSTARGGDPPVIYKNGHYRFAAGGLVPDQSHSHWDKAMKQGCHNMDLGCVKAILQTLHDRGVTFSDETLFNLRAWLSDNPKRMKNGKIYTPDRSSSYKNIRTASRHSNLKVDKPAEDKFRNYIDHREPFKWDKNCTQKLSQWKKAYNGMKNCSDIPKEVKQELHKCINRFEKFKQKGHSPNYGKLSHHGHHPSNHYRNARGSSSSNDMGGFMDTFMQQAVTGQGNVSDITGFDSLQNVINPQFESPDLHMFNNSSNQH